MSANYPLADRLRFIAELLPRGATVSFDAEALTAMAGSDGDCERPGSAVQTSSGIMPDLSVADICAATRRKRSTVHGWIKAGDLEAYDFGHEKRVTPGAWQEFLSKRRNRHVSVTETRAAPGRSPDLGDWRKPRQPPPAT